MAANAGSLAAAARTLGVNLSTVFRRIASLEDGLGARLFDRSREGLSLTAAGEEMMEIATRVEDEMNAVARRVAGRDHELTGTALYRAEGLEPITLATRPRHGQKNPEAMAEGRVDREGDASPTNRLGRAMGPREGPPYLSRRSAFRRWPSSTR